MRFGAATRGGMNLRGRPGALETDD